MATESDYMYVAAQGWLANYIDTPATRLVAAVRSQHLEQGTLIIPHDEVPVFHYYFPQAALKSYLNQDEMENLARAEKADALVRPNLDLELRR